MSMKRLLDFFSKKGRGEKRYRSWSEDPAKGIEYNKINATHRVSKRIYSVDLARTPRVVRGIGEWVNVHGKAAKANKDQPLVDYKRSLVNGRER